MSTGLAKIDGTTASYDIAYGGLDLSSNKFPAEITTLIVMNSKPEEVFEIPKIGEDFNRTLRTVKVGESCRHVTSIGNDFLALCKGIVSLDLSALCNVTNIGDGFLFACEGIVSLDLAPLSNVTSIGGGFLARCSGIKSLDLTPLTNVTSIGGGFLWGCEGITTLDLTPLTQVLSVGLGFLGPCSGLKEVQLLQCAPPMLVQGTLERIAMHVSITVVSDILM